MKNMNVSALMGPLFILVARLVPSGQDTSLGVSLYRSRVLRLTLLNVPATHQTIEVAEPSCQAPTPGSAHVALQAPRPLVVLGAQPSVVLYQRPSLVVGSYPMWFCNQHLQRLSPHLPPREGCKTPVTGFWRRLLTRSGFQISKAHLFICSSHTTIFF